MHNNLPIRVSKELTRKGFDAGLIHFEPEDDVSGLGIIARIGEYSFFFAGEEGEGVTPSEYLANIPEDDLVDELFNAMNAEPINGESVYDASEAMYYEFWLTEGLNRLKMSMTETTEIHATRMDGVKIETSVSVLVRHRPGLDILETIDRCMTEWYKTKEGKDAWEYSCGDYNIGDWLCSRHPSDEFTSRFGFVIDTGDNHRIVEIEYDRVLGGDSCEE